MRTKSPPVSSEIEELAVGELDQLHRFARFVTRDSVQAEDIILDVYARAFRSESIEGFNGRGGSVRAWLMTITREVLHERPNTTAWSARNHPAGFDRLPVHESPKPSQVGGVNWDAAGPRMSAGLDSMSEDLREMLWLWAVERMNYCAIGEMLSIPRETVVSRLHQARSQVARFVLEDRRLPVT